MEMWTCHVCMVKNPENASSCAACRSLAPTPEKRHWMCPTCTLLNQPTSMECKACGFSKIPTSIESIESQTQEWNCKRCSLGNSPRDTICKACGATVAGILPPKCGICKKPVLGPRIEAKASQKVFHMECLVCKKCGNPIEHQWKQVFGAMYHPHCFRCQGCNEPIEQQFQWNDSQEYFHPKCYLELFGERCCVCTQPLPQSYSILPFWDQKFCQYHKGKVFFCDGCHRLAKLPLGVKEPTNLVRLGDEERWICDECVSSCLFTNEDAKEMMEEVHQFAEKQKYGVRAHFPIILVQSEVLQERARAEQQGVRHTQTRGLCMSSSCNRLHTVQEQFGFGQWASRVVAIEKHCEVTAVLLLFGLPKELMGSILAHELMHAYCRLNALDQLPPPVEEGLCNLCSFVYLKQGQESDVKKVWITELEQSPSPVYGEGFRQAVEAYLKYGFQATLDHVRQTNAFPI